METGSCTQRSRFKCAGELDLVFNYPGDDLAELQKERPKEVKVSPALSTNYLVMKLSEPPFRDARVCRALSISLDRQGIGLDLVLAFGFAHR